MAWSMKLAAFSGTGSAGRNATETIDAIVRSSNIAADFGLSERYMMQYVYSQIATGYVPMIGPLGSTYLDRIERKLTSPAAGVWKVTFVYRDQNMSRPTGDAAFSFSTTGGTQHIISSVNDHTTGYDYATKAPTDPTQKSLIGADTRGNNPTGISVNTPAFHFKSEYFVSASNISGVVSAISNLQGPLNNAAVSINIRGLTITAQPGELLFTGVEGAERNGFGDWSVVLFWAKSPNVTQTVGGKAIQKRGWDYVDVVPMPFANQTNNTTGQQIAYVLVHQVYYEDDLNTIIPGGSINAQPFGGVGNPPPVVSGPPPIFTAK